MMLREGVHESPPPQGKKCCDATASDLAGDEESPSATCRFRYSRPMAMSIDDLISEARARINSLTPQEAAAAMADGAILVDTRCTADHEAEGVIPGSVHHPRTVLEWRLDPASERPDPAIADRSLQHIIMCNDGYSSILAAANLERMGFERIAHLEGGFRAWKQAGLPVAADP